MYTKLFILFCEPANFMLLMHVYDLLIKIHK